MHTGSFAPIMRKPLTLIALLLATGLATAGPAPLRLAVMDPLAADLSCPCVDGHAQRDYPALVAFLEDQLERPIQPVFVEELGIAREKLDADPDLIIGKHSVVAYDLKKHKIDGRPIAALTDQTGRTTLRGLFVVRADDPASGPADLAGDRIVFGPHYADDKFKAALMTLARAGVIVPAPPKTAEGCNIAAVAVADGEADAGVISDYALPLLEGCGNIEKGSLKIIGRTDPVPFISAWATSGIDAAAEAAIVTALRSVTTRKDLCQKMETARGFVPVTWPGFGGPDRNFHSAHVPARLPASPKFLWRRPATACSVGGISATPRFVIVSDKSADEQRDIFRCLRADTGAPVWTLDYPAPGEMDYGNAPRATPLVAGSHVYLLGAFGHLHCVDLETGKVIWKRHLAKGFGADVPTWGYSVSPLMVDGTLIINPGAKDASVAALDALTGKTVWKTPGGPAAYAAFTLAKPGGPHQIVGFDAESIGGWHPVTGTRLWKLVPPENGDFNVPAALPLGDRLVLASENNGARMHRWSSNEKLMLPPLATNDLMTPDTCTPVHYRGRIYATGLGAIVCLDADTLKTVWQHEDDAFDSHTSIIAGNDRLLVQTMNGELILLNANADRFAPVSRIRPVADTETWSNPALTPGRLFLRTQTEVVCLEL